MLQLLTAGENPIFPLNLNDTTALAPIWLQDFDLLLSELALSGVEDDSHAESDNAVWEDFRELCEDTERAPLFLSCGGSSVEQMSKYSS